MKSSALQFCDFLKTDVNVTVKKQKKLFWKLLKKEQNPYPNQDRIPVGKN